MSNAYKKAAINVYMCTAFFQCGSIASRYNYDCMRDFSFAARSVSFFSSQQKKMFFFVRLLIWPIDIRPVWPDLNRIARTFLLLYILYLSFNV